MNRASRFSMGRLWRMGMVAIALCWPLASTAIIYAGDEVQVADGGSDGNVTAPSTSFLNDQQTGAQNSVSAADAGDGSATDEVDLDPWESFNEKMFWFNREVLDRYLLKPVATAWDFVLPDAVQRSLHNAFDNLAVVRRVVNNALQLKLAGAAKEVARFGINSTLGVGGLFDMAKDGFGIEESDEDMGLTLGGWGVGPGPYLVLPFLPPLTVRDGIGYAIDSAMTPYVYFAPWYVTFAGETTNIVNERSLNLDRFERVAESTVDLYSAVRNAYLQRRAAAIKQ
jgi:phospholipid-binding lipoprotein MlaA